MGVLLLENLCSYGNGSGLWRSLLRRDDKFGEVDCGHGLLRQFASLVCKSELSGPPSSE